MNREIDQAACYGNIIHEIEALERPSELFFPRGRIL